MMQWNWDNTFGDSRRGRPRAAGLSILILGLIEPASARINRISIASVQSPTFGGVSFGNVGQYEKLVGRAFGEIDPKDPRNAMIADITSRRVTQQVWSSIRWMFISYGR